MRTRTTILAELLLVGWLVPVSVHGQTTWYVDDDNCPGPGSGTDVDPFCSIQDGIDAGSDTDTVLVSPGTYNETINFNGKGITLRSADGPDMTTIDGTGLSDSVVKCVTNEGPSTVLDGFTITGGDAMGSSGGGMLNENSSPTVMNCRFIRNSTATGGGGGMRNTDSSPWVINCLFAGNSASDGGGMFNERGHPEIFNCAFVGNRAIGTDVPPAGNNGGGW